MVNMADNIISRGLTLSRTLKITYLSLVFVFSLLYKVDSLVEKSSRRSGLTEEAISRLTQVFQIPKVPKVSHHRSPPEYMLDLYKQVTYSDGITKGANPFNADIVRGFSDKGEFTLIKVKHSESY